MSAVAMKAARSTLLLATSLALVATLAACTKSTTIEQRPRVTGSSTDPTDPGDDTALGDGTTTDNGDPTTNTGKDDTGDDTTQTDDPNDVGSTPALATTRMKAVSDALATATLDVATLPATMSALTSKQRMAVMKSFTAALGGNCATCHASASDFSTETAQMKITRGMWTKYVRGLTLADGTAMYCDNCHQGQTKFLVRTGGTQLRNWMQKNFVDALAQSNRSAQTCASCHGTPFVGDFLATW